MSEVVDKVKRSPLLRDLVVASVFVLVGIAAQSGTDPLIGHLAGSAIGFGFGFGIRSLIVDRDAKNKAFGKQ